MEKYRAEPECRGSVYQTVRLLLEIDEFGLKASLHAHSPDALRRGQAVATGYNKAAQVAADKGCSDVARELWLSVIENYIGSGYAAMRQRAQIGIDDLRTASQRPAANTAQPKASE